MLDRPIPKQNMLCAKGVFSTACHFSNSCLKIFISASVPNAQNVIKIYYQYVKQLRIEIQILAFTG